MDKAKAAINDFMHKSGKHDTTVHETVSPAVQHETVKPQHHENITTAVDKEVHQDHYHRTVQPVQDREVLPEQHHAKLGAVQHREFDHRDHEHTKRNLAQEQAAFKDERVVHDTQHTQSTAPAIGGEHVHHHIHETIQPVVHKETIQPHVTHTTVPIHETHHNSAQHHETTHLPAMSINDFKAKGGALSGREERYDGFEGEPKNIGGVLGSVVHGKSGHGHESTHQHGVGSTHNDGLRDGGVTGTHGTHGTHGSRGIDGVGSDGHHTTTGTTGTTGTKPKASFMDKLNPRKDADGDGKGGFMD